MNAWKSRIVGAGEEAPDQLLANPFNIRLHPMEQQERMAAILREHGWISDVIVNQRTGHLIDGHMRVTLANREGEATIPVKYVDVSPDEEKSLLALYDRIGEEAAIDREKMAELLTDLTGFGSSDEFSSMLEDLKDEFNDAFTMPSAPTSAAFATNHYQERADQYAVQEQQGDTAIPIRQMQFYLNTDEHEEVVGFLRSLAAHYGTSNATETFVRVLREQVAVVERETDQAVDILVSEEPSLD